jgi:hypothetical protein
MRRMRIGLAGVVAALAVVGCGGGKGSVSGAVTVDGESVDDGSIVFTPTGGAGRPVGTSIKDGKYAIDDDRGLVAGAHKVEITWNKRTGKKSKDTADTGEVKDERKQVLGPEHNSASKHTFDIKAGVNKADFALKGGVTAPGAGGAGPKKGTAVGD